MLALREQGFGEVKMGGGGGDDAQGVAGGGGFGQGGENARAVFCGDFAGGFGGGVIDAGELHLAGGGEFGIDAGVFLAERTDAQHQATRILGVSILTRPQLCQFWRRLKGENGRNAGAKTGESREASQERARPRAQQGPAGWDGWNSPTIHPPADVSVPGTGRARTLREPP